MVESTGEFYYPKGVKVSKEEAKDYALIDARAKAVEQAYGSSVTVFERLSKKPSKLEDFYALYSSQTNGAVQILESEYEYNKKYVKVNVKALVSKTNKDSFIKVNNIKTRYSITEPINFEVVFYDSGYLYVFGISTETKGTQIYPNDQESYSNYYTKNSVQKFPTKTHIHYIPVRRVEGVQPRYMDGLPKDPYNFFLCEKGVYNKMMTMFFVLLKSTHPFKTEVTYNNIMKWYFDIPEEDKNGMEVKTFWVE